MTTNSKPNRLSKEKSPYLQQHAFNPVDWFPWSEEAFEKAKAESKPIFLSIGYSTCHWCHVMERESFEDHAVAALLNERFVSIKVDREERPDIDHLYMSVCQTLTGRGGWPLTVIMSPDKKPFFAGTYYPKRRRHSRIGLMELLDQLSDKWNNDRDKVVEISEQIVTETGARLLSSLQGDISEETLDQAYDNYAHLFDPQYGGFGSAPKFPTSHNLSLLLRYYVKTGKQQALEMVEKTLESMYRGGMYDHIGYGFARYSTDQRWLVPHFEKMLYDNAMLSITYLEAYQVTGKRLYADVAKQIFAYVLRDMTDEGGAFYCAEDADSEGEEGKFYVWTPDEIMELLGETEGKLICELFDIMPGGNFEGSSIPNLLEEWPAAFAARKGMTEDELGHRMETSRRKLFEHREKRIHPHKDDKILTSWNGFMIAALSKGAKALGEPIYADAANRAADFVLSQLRREDGRLLARYRDGEAAFLGYVDDYAYLVWGLIELYEATFEERHLRIALELTNDMLRLFWDEEKGGFFFNGHDGEQMFTRIKEIYDGAMPSGNSVAALNMARLSRLTGSDRLVQFTERQLQTFAGAVQRYPSGHALFLTAMHFANAPGQEIVMAGSRNDGQLKRLIAEVHRQFMPNAVLAVNWEDGKLEEMMPFAADKRPIDGKAAAYVCANFACQAPVTDAESLRTQLLSK